MNVEAIYVGGVFRPLSDVPVAENQRVRLTIEAATEATAATPIRTAEDLLNSSLVGSWANRDDIRDSREFARQLRQQAEARGGANHAAG